MQFIVTGYDGTDDGAKARRAAVREAHLKGVDAMKAAGQILFGTAILDDQENMIGSVMVMEFPSRSELDQWLKEEPYITGEVWKKHDVKPCRVAPSFMTK